MDISTSRPIFLCLMLQSLWLVLLCWKSIWVLLLLLFLLLLRFFNHRSVSLIQLVGAAAILCPLLFGLSGNRTFSIDNVQILFTLAAILMLFRPLKKEFVQNIFVIHLFILGLALYDQKSVFIFVVMFLDALFIISLVFVSEQYPLSISSLKELTGSMLKVLLQTLPFIIVFYGLIPALSLQNNNQVDTTFSGASFTKEVRPGRIDRLLLSDRPMFKVKFLTKNLPIRDSFYWRTQVFPDGDGLNWKLGKETALKEATSISLDDRKALFHYQLWPHRDLYPIVPTLEHFAGIHVSELDPFYVDHVGTLKMVNLPSDDKPVALIGATDPIGSEDSPDPQTKSVKKKPSARILELVQDWKKGGDDSLDFYFIKMTHYYQNHHFIYTLTPGKIRSVEHFLFESKAGFCEHYAAISAYLFRLAGYHARVVAGFHGGEHASEPGMWEVTGKDAHAWLEVWSKEANSWRRFDPISYIAPERLKWGGQRYFSLMERGALAGLFPSSLRAVAWQGIHKLKQWTFHIQNIGDKLIDEFMELTRGLFKSNLMTGILICLILSLVLIPIFRSWSIIRIRILDLIFLTYFKKFVGPQFRSEDLLFKDRLLESLKKSHGPHYDRHQNFIHKWLRKRYDPKSKMIDWWQLVLALAKLRA